MQLIEIGLLALACWLVWYLIHALAAFSTLRDMQATQPQREAEFLAHQKFNSAFLGLSRSIPGQGRGHPCGDRFTPSNAVFPASLQGLHEAALPPLRTSDDWPEVLLREAAQAVLRG